MHQHREQPNSPTPTNSSNRRISSLACVFLPPGRMSPGKSVKLIRRESQTLARIESSAHRFDDLPDERRACCTLLSNEKTSLARQRTLRLQTKLCTVGTFSGELLERQHPRGKSRRAACLRAVYYHCYINIIRAERSFWVFAGCCIRFS